MSRIDELQKRYPSVPRQYVVRCDCKAHGIRDTGKLDELGVWLKMVGLGSYATYDHDVTLKEWVDMKPGRQKPGYVLRPGRFVLPENGLDIDNKIARVNTKSDLEVRAEGSGKYALYQEDERVEEVLYLPRKVQEEPMTSSGTPASNSVTRCSKHCFLIVPVRHCEYFPLGVACKFCNFNDTQDDAHSIGLKRSTTISLEETFEAYKIFASGTRIVEGTFELGGFTKSENEVRIHTSFIEKMASATPYKPNFRVVAQPMARKELQRLKDAGLECLCHQMEIWDPDLFSMAVPGKSQYTGHNRYLEAVQEAVDVFGVGNVACGFVGGLSLIPENGHETWQEARDSTIEGNTWMIKHGVLPVETFLRLSPGSAWGTEENRMKYPPTEYYLEVALAHHAAMKQYGLYDKLNRLIRCPLENLTSAIGVELGIYEVAGSLANWTAGCVPREANWHLDWEEQRKSLMVG